MAKSKKSKSGKGRTKKRVPARKKAARKAQPTLFESFLNLFKS